MKIYFATRQEMRNFTKKAPLFKQGKAKEMCKGRMMWPASAGIKKV